MKQWHIVGALVIIAALLLTTTALTLFGTNDQPSPPATTPQHYTYTVVHTYPHNENAFTEGLVYANGFFYESTGLESISTLRKVDLETGNTLQMITLPREFFGEGITIVNDTIVQLTWLSQHGFVYDRETLSLQRNFTYTTEGWGITFNGTCLIMSDGTDNLYFLNPVTYQNIGHIKVHDGNVSVVNLNELEYVNGDVYANIWHQQKIAVIDPETGQVKAWIDLTGLENSTALNSESVLNGIAYDAENNKLFVTGKNWPHLYEIKLVPVT